MDDGYHDESYGEQMEAQHGVYEGNEPPMLFPSDVDAALRRIDNHVLATLNVTPAISTAMNLRAIREVITEERKRLGLPVEIKA